MLAAEEQRHIQNIRLERKGKDFFDFIIFFIPCCQPRHDHMRMRTTWEENTIEKARAALTLSS
jgi:hypothetical protein